MKQPNNSKAMPRKRKGSANKSSNKRSKRSKTKTETLQSTLSVKDIALNSTDHSPILNNVGPTKKKTAKKSAPKKKRKASAKKRKNTPAKSTKSVGNSNLPVTLEALNEGIPGSDYTVTEEGGYGFNSPGEAYETGDLGQVPRTEAEFVNHIVPHNSDGTLQQESEHEVQQEESDVLADVEEDILTNWEHYGLLIEEYFMAADVVNKK